MALFKELSHIYMEELRKITRSLMSGQCSLIMASPYENVVCVKGSRNHRELQLTMPLSTVCKIKVVTIHVCKTIVTHCEWV
jgi:hypothetical protein